MNKEIVLPNYNHSILNVISSILKYYNVQTKHSGLKSLDEIINKKYSNVILIILDGMGEHILNNISKEGYFNKHKVDCITSVYPSTTTAALTTYYSGKPPIETGYIAWSQYFKEYGRNVDMLSHQESYLHEDISKAKINVFDTIMKYESVFEQIEKASPNVKTYEITPTYSDKRAKRSIRADNISEIVDEIKMLCKVPEEKFILAYSDNPDGIIHDYGTDSEEAKEFILDTEEKIKKMCSELGDDTLVIISADHGHKNIGKAYNLLDYPEIQECLYMPVSLESRVAGFMVKENMKKEFEERFNRVFKDEFWLMTVDEFLKKNFLGYGDKHPKIDEFLGNYIALSVSGSIIKICSYLGTPKPTKKSTHCGLTKDEMEVPLIII